MGLLECASQNSLWRGLDYFQNNKVKSLMQTGDTTYTANVEGNNGALYSVEIDTAHVRSSKCNCPHAEGKRIVCKHKIAVFLTAFPKEAERLEAEYRHILMMQEAEEQAEQELESNLIEYVHSMKKSELEQVLLTLLFDGPDWQFENFVQEHLYDEDFCEEEEEEEEVEDDDCEEEWYE